MTTETRKKIKSLFLSWLMVMSVTAGVAAFSGGAGAAPSDGLSAADPVASSVDDGGVTAASLSPPSGVGSDDTPSDTVVPGERTTVADVTFSTSGNVSSVSVNLAAGTEAANITADDVDNVNVTLFSDTSGELASSGDVSYDALVTTVDFSNDSAAVAGNVTGVDRVVIRAETNEFNAENGDVIDAAFNTTDAAGDDASFSTAENQTIETDTDARLRGEVVWQNGSPADNVTIQIVDTDTGNVLIDDIVTNGFDTNQPGVWSPQTRSPGNYTVELDDTGGTVSGLLGSVQVFSTRVELERGETEKIETVLDPLEQVGPLECEGVVAFAGEEGTLTITAENEENSLLQGASVQAVGKDGSEAVTLLNNVTKTTDANGQVTYNATANITASATFTFEVSSGGDTGTVECSAVFVQNGEGQITGDVRDEATTDPIEDARVWAVLASSYVQNERYTRINLSAVYDNLGVTGDNRDDVVWIRLVDSDTGEIVDNDDYDVRNEEFNRTNDGNTSVTAGEGGFNPENDTGVRLVEDFNVTNASEGEGFAVVDLDGDGLVAFNHTRIAPEDYYVQISLDAPNASRNDGVDRQKQQLPEDDDQVTQPWPGDEWRNVTSVDANGTVTSSTAAATSSPVGSGSIVAEFEPPANLTMAQTARLADLADSNLVDAPGFENSWGENTAGTDVNGDFELSKLFTNFQDGRAYVVIAEKAGYSTDFHDAFVREDGTLRLGDSEEVESFNLLPEPPEPGQVNITQVGTHPDAAFNESLVTRFDEVNENPGDDIFQRIPRDGRTIDVIQVTTKTEDGSLEVGGNVTVTFDEYPGEDPFSPTVVGVVNGTFESQTGPSGNSIKINTGDGVENGTALLLVQTDLDSESSRVNKTAELEADPSRDHSNATFVGVIQFREASISGKVTDTDDDRIEDAAVWANQFSFGPNFAVRIRPTAGDNADAVDEDSDTFNVTIYRDVDADIDLEPQESAIVTAGGLRSFTFSQFDSIDNVNNTQFRLYDRTEDTQGSYTLDPVPAVNNSFVETDYRIRGIKLDEPNKDEVSNDGLASVFPLTTDDANVVIPINITQSNFEVSNLSAPSAASPGDNITVTADVTNTGGLDSQEVVFRLDANQNGDFTDSADVELSAGTVQLDNGETKQVSVEVTVPDVNGTFEHGLFSEDTAATDTIEISSDGGNGTVVEQYDANDDGDISTDELNAAIQDWGAGDLETDELNQVIQAWAASS
ncbi:hypothetical protein BRD00_00250 [Halobacteriales archaeon QS_8_69_26]|nr:MAG: hypothetical protein BRD00_00250 [Halobacteriales archaeon QS_8_69_26]